MRVVFLMAADQADNGNGVSFTGDAISLIETIPGDWAGALRTDYRAFPDLRRRKQRAKQDLCGY